MIKKWLLYPYRTSLTFVRSGWVNVSTDYEGAMRYVGGSGYEWSRTASSSAAVYRLGFSSTGLGMNAEDRYWGFPLRCLYPGSA